tara:strand:+ start:435 stop:1244 length:810 start_codon:yes stop_codon:yes gene_type:complete
MLKKILVVLLTSMTILLSGCFSDDKSKSLNIFTDFVKQYGLESEVIETMKAIIEMQIKNDGFGGVSSSLDWIAMGSFHVDNVEGNGPDNSKAKNLKALAVNIELFYKLINLEKEELSKNGSLFLTIEPKYDRIGDYHIESFMEAYVSLHNKIYKYTKGDEGLIPNQKLIDKDFLDKPEVASVIRDYFNSMTFSYADFMVFSEIYSKYTDKFLESYPTNDYQKAYQLPLFKYMEETRLAQLDKGTKTYQASELKISRYESELKLAKSRIK